MSRVKFEEARASPADKLEIRPTKVAEEKFRPPPSDEQQGR